MCEFEGGFTSLWQTASVFKVMNTAEVHGQM